ncbi:hypothetical protein Tco_0596844 [Tanacetum coccineum]
MQVEVTTSHGAILQQEKEKEKQGLPLSSLSMKTFRKFHKITDAKEMWEAIKSRFGGNDESKKMQKYILKQQFESFSVSSSEGLHKGYDMFQSLLSQLEIHDAGVSTEDANQKFLSTQNVAFVSSESTSNTNNVSTAYGVSTSSGHNSQKEGSSSYTDKLKYSFFANQSSGPQLDHEDLEQIDEFDLEEPKALVTLYGYGVDWIGHAEDGQENFVLMAYKNSGSNTEVTSCTKEREESYAKLKKLYDEQKEQLGDASIEIQAYTQALKKMSAKDKSGLGYGDQIHEGVLSYENEVLESVFDSRSSDVEDSPVYDRFAKVKGMHAVPPLMTGIYMPPKSDFGIDELNFTYGLKQSKTSESAANTSDSVSCESNSSVETLESVPKPAVNEPKAVSKPKVWSDAPIIEEYESDSDDEYVETVKEQNTCSLTPKAEKRDWNGKMSKNLVNAARQNPSSQAAETSIARKVNTARPIMNEIRHRNNFYKSHLPIRRPFNKSTASKANFTNPKVNTAGDKIVSAVGGYRETVVRTSAGCNWRSKRHYWNKVSKYNSGSNSSKNVNFKDPLGRPKSAMAWKRIKKLEKKCKPSISHHRAWLKSVQRLSMKKRLGKKESVSKQGRKNAKSKPTLDAFDDLDADLAHGMDYMETEEAVNEGRQSNETEELNLDVDTKIIAEDKGSGEKGGNIGSTARPEVDTARPDVDVVRQEVSVVEPRTPPTTTSIFDDEDITMAQTLIKIKEEKAKEKGVAFKDVKDSSRPARSVLTLKPLPSIDPKDKGKGILVEEEPVKIKRKDQGIDQIERDEELAHKLHEEELAEIARIQEEKTSQEKASKVAIMEMFDEVQAGIDANALFASNL